MSVHLNPSSFWGKQPYRKTLDHQDFPFILPHSSAFCPTPSAQLIGPGWASDTKTANHLPMASLWLGSCPEMMDICWANQTPSPIIWNWYEADVGILEGMDAPELLSTSGGVQRAGSWDISSLPPGFRRSNPLGRFSWKSSSTFAPNVL